MTHPTIAEIRDAARALDPALIRTPSLPIGLAGLRDRVGREVDLHAKFELWQHTGSFKPRGALCVLAGLTAEERARGVVGFSAGNHGLALAWSARRTGCSARVVMPQTADPHRIEAVRALGAEVELLPSIHEARHRVQEICDTEGASFVHPFEGPRTVLGTATLGLELIEQIEDLDAVVVPIGGGGLCAGVSAAVKQMRPETRVIGVEPTGADTMNRSFEAGEPVGIDAVRTIADSLGAPTAEPYTFSVCREFVDEIVLVDDDQLREAIRLLYYELKLAVEPAGAASTAAVLHPLRGRLDGQRVALVFCGANVAPQKLLDDVTA